MDGSSTAAASHRQTINTTLNTMMRSSAFEVYRKPPPVDISNNAEHCIAATDTSSITAAAANHQRLSTAAGTAAAAQATASVGEYERRVAAITDSLRHVSFKQSERNVADVVHHLREQNHLLMQLCSDLTEELASVHRKKEELRVRYEGNSSNATTTNNIAGQQKQPLKQVAHHHHSMV